MKIFFFPLGRREKASFKKKKLISQKEGEKRFSSLDGVKIGEVVRVCVYLCVWWGRVAWLALSRRVFQAEVAPPDLTSLGTRILLPV